MKTLLLLAFLAGVFNDDAFLNSAIFLSGASCIEELDEEEIELYRHLHEHPLAINTAPRARLQSSGLFSVFQIESLLRYREEYGEILSITDIYTETAMLDAMHVNIGTFDITFGRPPFAGSGKRINTGKFYILHQIRKLVPVSGSNLIVIQFSLELPAFLIRKICFCDMPGNEPLRGEIFRSDLASSHVNVMVV